MRESGGRGLNLCLFNQRRAEQIFYVLLPSYLHLYYGIVNTVTVHSNMFEFMIASVFQKRKRSKSSKEFYFVLKTIDGEM